jgi:hypothetical protein
VTGREDTTGWSWDLRDGYSGHVPRKPTADDDLSPDNHGSLNTTFYAAKPNDYFGRRLQNLILTAGNRRAVDELLAAGVQFGGLIVAGSPPTTQGTDEDAATDEAVLSEETGDEAEKLEAEEETTAQHFVTAEAEVLAHHVEETLLRLYLAHEFHDGEPAPACPMLDLARLRWPADFNERLRQRFGPDSDPQDGANLRAVARVFHATDARENLLPDPPAAELWDKSLRNIEGYLRAFATKHLEGAALYNAAKHGLALIPGDSSFQVGDGSLVKAQGPAIRHLEVRDDADGHPRWKMVTHWVKADLQMALVYHACSLIDALWETARYRYLATARAGGYQLRLFGGASYAELYFSGGPTTGIITQNVRMDLLYLRSAREDGPAPEEQANATPRGHGSDVLVDHDDASTADEKDRPD